MTDQTQTIRRLDPAALRDKRARRLTGEPFVLEHTEDEPVEVIVRRPDIFDADVLDSFPSQMQEAVFALIEETQALEGETDRDKAVDKLRQMPMERLIRNYGNTARIAKAYCLAGFLEPRCYATPEEADAKGGVWVEDIAHADRMRFMSWCMNTAKEAVEPVVQTFPDEPAGHQWSGPAGTTVSGTEIPGPHHSAPGATGGAGDEPGGGPAPHQ